MSWRLKFSSSLGFVMLITHRGTSRVTAVDKEQLWWAVLCILRRLLFSDPREIPHVDPSIRRCARQAGGKVAVVRWGVVRPHIESPPSHIVSLCGDQANCKTSSVCASSECSFDFVFRISQSATVCRKQCTVSVGCTARLPATNSPHLVARPGAENEVVCWAEDDGVDLGTMRILYSLLWAV